MTSSKSAIAQVAIERVPSETGNVNVRLTIIVEVGDCHTHSPSLARQAGCTRDVAEFEIRILMVERDHRVATLAVAINRRAIHRDDVELAIVIAIDQASAAAHGLDNVFLFRSRNMGDGQTGFPGDIFESGVQREEM